MNKPERPSPSAIMHTLGEALIANAGLRTDARIANSGRPADVHAPSDFRRSKSRGQS
jgi:hypothetical protein